MWPAGRVMPRTVVDCTLCRKFTSGMGFYITSLFMHMTYSLYIVYIILNSWSLLVTWYVAVNFKSNNYSY